jgi:hypothetical protein
MGVAAVGAAAFYTSRRSISSAWSEASVASLMISRQKKLATFAGL